MAIQPNPGMEAILQAIALGTQHGNEIVSQRQRQQGLNIQQQQANQSAQLFPEILKGHQLANVHQELQNKLEQSKVDFFSTPEKFDSAVEGIKSSLGTLSKDEDAVLRVAAMRDRATKDTGLTSTMQAVDKIYNRRDINRARQDTAKPIEDKQRYQDITQKKILKQPVSPEDDAWAQAYEKANPAFQKNQINIGNQGDARSDRSYNLVTKRLDAIRKPIDERLERISRLEATINERSPQADALIAPELLTAMAGGQGSALRMSEAEIARIVGGRTNWESLKAAVNKWRLDPSKGLSVTDSQREQIHSLVSVISQRVKAKQSILDDAEDELNATSSVAEHRRIFAETRRKISDIDEGKQSPQTQGAGRTVNW